MLKHTFSLLTLVILGCSTHTQVSNEFTPMQIVDLNHLQPSALTNHGKALIFHPDSANQSLILSEASPEWVKAKYLVINIIHHNPYSSIIYLDFYRQGGNESSIEQQGDATNASKPRISAKIGILPDLPTQLIFPLSHLDGQEIFLHRFPRQLKGTVLGNRLDPSEISKVALRLEPFRKPDFRPEITISNIRLMRDLPQPLPKPQQPVVDQFGQWTERQWPDKTTDETDLKDQIDSLYQAASASGYPADWSEYGGWKKKKFDVTGYFHTHHDGLRWWLVDPEGYAFLSTGVDCIGASASGVVSGQEDIFDWLPGKTDTLFTSATNQRNDINLIDFLEINLIRAFGKNWQSNWESMTSGLLKYMHFNTIGNWSDLQYARISKLPYVLPLRDFPSTGVSLYRDFPDVFADEYKTSAEKFARQLEAYKNDPFLIGYFLRNEPQWAFGYHNLAFEMFATDQMSDSKKAFVDWVKKNYGNDIKKFAIAWNIKINTFEDLLHTTFRDLPSETADKDFYTFSEILVKRYVDIPCDAVEAVDPNHLNLGMRYAWISSDLLYKAGERFDVFSINGYSFPGPPSTQEIAAKSGKPVMIGEYHFGSIDAGLPSTGIKGVKNQQGRATAFRYYTEQGFARPEVVGLHYFQWNDQPVFGRFDGENYNIGFLDICSRPYAQLSQGARLTNSRMYQVASGMEKPFDEVAVEIPAIYF